ncbi:MAG: SAM-dependent methyltransferase [Treponema sp.]|jgi:type I restriction-modification system DNA methylase subunit|nr:SAM-dependent methyltransferase [Treponema sp.]
MDCSTPQHLTEFMFDFAEVNKNSKIIDICCTSGTFLVTAMNKMFMGVSDKDIEKIRKSSLFGVERQDEIYTLAVANMIIRGDGVVVVSMFYAIRNQYPHGT